MRAELSCVVLDQVLRCASLVLESQPKIPCTACDFFFF